MKKAVSLILFFASMPVVCASARSRSSSGGFPDISATVVGLAVAGGFMFLCATVWGALKGGSKKKEEDEE